MVGLPPASLLLFRVQPYALEISLSRAEHPEKAASVGLPRGGRPDAAEYIKLSLALARATGCNSKPIPPSGI